MAEHVTADRSEAPASARELAKTRGSSMLLGSWRQESAPEE